jgi:hypothetical protein
MPRRCTNWVAKPARGTTRAPSAYNMAIKSYMAQNGGTLGQASHAVSQGWTKKAKAPKKIKFKLRPRNALADIV